MKFLRKLFDKEPAKTLSTYAEFWVWFAQNEQAFFNIIQSGDRIPEGFINPVRQKLNELRAECYFLLVGMADEEQVELVVSADGVVKNFVFVEDLVKEAPSLPNWKFTPLKPAIDFKERGLEMGGVRFSSKEIQFYPVEVEAYPDLIALKLTHADFNEEQKGLISNGVYIYLDHLLGERNFVSTIDEFEVVSESSIPDDLVPIEKINDYLLWRQKEFIEKYEGQRKTTEDDQFVLLEATSGSGNTMLSTLNADLLKWDSKASHPWILVVKIEYDTKRDDGLPDDGVAAVLNSIEDLFLPALKEENGYLHIGRETGDWLREIFFACQEMDWCSRKISEIIEAYDGPLKIEYDLYKDKYWRSFDKYDLP